MGRIITTGWELGNQTDGGQWIDGGIDNTSASAGAARSGGFGLLVDTSDGFNRYLQKEFSTDPITYHYFYRVYIRVSTNVGAQSIIFRALRSGSVPVWSLRLNTDRTVELWNDSDSAQIGSDSPGMTINTWYRIEAEFSVNGVLVYLALGDGGRTEFGSGDQSGLDTGETGGILQLGNLSNTTAVLHFDDLAINNTDGTFQNGLPGPGYTVVAMPNAAGDNAMGTRGGTDSGSDWGQVDEKPPNDATDYYILDVDNDILDLNIESVSALIPKSATINVVQVGARHRASAALLTTYQTRIKSQTGGTVETGTARNHDDTLWRTNGDSGFGFTNVRYSLTSYTDPQTGGRWTVPLLDGAQIGVIATAATLADFWITTLWAMIDYMPTRVRDPIRSGGMVVPFPR